MSSKSISIVDILKASPGNAPIVSQDKVAYNISRTLAEFDSLDLITKEAALTIPGTGGTLIPVPVIPAGTVIPFFIDVTLYTGSDADSRLITKVIRVNPITGVPTGQLQRFYDIDVVEDDTNHDGSGDFTGWNIYGHDDGSGNFKEDTYVTIVT